MSASDRETPPAAAPGHQVFGVPAGEQEERLIKSFERAFEAAAFAKLLSAGGRYERVRVQAPASAGQDESERAVADEPLQAGPRPGGAYMLLYASSLVLGALASLVLGFLGAFIALVWLDKITGVALGPKAIVAIAMAVGAVLTAVVVKIHAAVFRDRK